MDIADFLLEIADFLLKITDFMLEIADFLLRTVGFPFGIVDFCLTLYDTHLMWRAFLILQDLVYIFDGVVEKYLTKQLA